MLSRALSPARVPALPLLLSRILRHLPFKCLGSLAFALAFFLAYFLLLRHPVFPVATVPRTLADELVPFTPLALPVYASLWLYLSIPPLLMVSRAEVLEYGFWLGALCVAGLSIFLLWPTATPPADIDWSTHPSMAFLKHADTSGNACPSLHVASAVWCAFAFDRMLGQLGGSRGVRIGAIAWCAAIVLSTMATRQHLALDVAAGAALGLLFAALQWRPGRLRAAQEPS
jgi:membrane-associated phospholipid phosphatase